MSLAGIGEMFDLRRAEVVREFSPGLTLVRNADSAWDNYYAAIGLSVAHGSTWDCAYCKGKAPAASYRCGKCGAPR